LFILPRFFINRMRLQLKDVFSLANGLSGFFALPLFFLVGYFPAAAMVLLALVFDFLDGKVARKSRGDDEFGKQLDSLADAVSFGAVPPFLLLSFHSLYSYSPNGGFWVFYPLLLGGLFFLGACLIRLALFNVQKEKGVYHGLPSPLAAALAVVFGWLNPYVGIILLFVLGAAMLSKFKLKKVF